MSFNEFNFAYLGHPMSTKEAHNFLSDCGALDFYTDGMSYMEAIRTRRARPYSLDPLGHAPGTSDIYRDGFNGADAGASAGADAGASAGAESEASTEAEASQTSDPIPLDG